MPDNLFNPKLIKVNLESSDKDELFEEMMEIIVRAGYTLDRSECMSALEKREEKQNTGVVSGVAIPHAVSTTVESTVCAVGISRGGVEYDSADGKVVKLVFMVLLSVNDDSVVHLKVMQRIASFLQDSDFCNSLMQLDSPDAVFKALMSVEN